MRVWLMISNPLSTVARQDPTPKKTGDVGSANFIASVMQFQRKSSVPARTSHDFRPFQASLPEALLLL